MPKTMFRFGITSFAELRVEYDGLLLPQHEGKMHAEDLKNYLARFFADDTWQHMANPKMVYLSYPTEYGTLYSRSELEAIHRISRHAIDMAMHRSSSLARNRYRSIFSRPPISSSQS